MNDELDALLREALKHQLNHKKGEGTVKRLKAIDATLAYSMSLPSNWIDIEMVDLIHQGSDGQTSLGIFKQSIHRRSPARRLTRATSDEIQSITYTIRQEIVHGDYWMVAKPSPRVSTEEAEMLAVREYLTRPKAILTVKAKKANKAINTISLLKELESL